MLNFHIPEAHCRFAKPKIPLMREKSEDYNTSLQRDWDLPQISNLRGGMRATYRATGKDVAQEMEGK